MTPNLAGESTTFTADLFLRWTACCRFRDRSTRIGATERLGRRQSRDGPTRAADGDELILPVRKAGFKINLNRFGPGLDQPRTVFLLRVQQKSDAALVDWIVGGESGFSEHPQRLPGRVGIAGHLRKLSPTAVVALGIQDGLARGGDLFLAGAEKMHPPLSGVPVLLSFRLGVEEPAFGLLDAVVRAGCLRVGGKFLQVVGGDRHAGRGRILQWRASLARVEAAVLFLRLDEVGDHGFGGLIGLPLGDVQGPERVGYGHALSPDAGSGAQFFRSILEAVVRDSRLLLEKFLVDLEAMFSRGGLREHGQRLVMAGKTTAMFFVVDRPLIQDSEPRVDGLDNFRQLEGFFGRIDRGRRRYERRPTGNQRQTTWNRFQDRVEKIGPDRAASGRAHIDFFTSSGAGRLRDYE